MGREEDECAQEVLDVVPSVMRFIRAEMRRHRALGLSIPQFRTLVFIERTNGTSLGSVAEHLGLTPPSACKIVDGLQERALITRAVAPEDRRRLTLQITPGGKHAVTEARRETQRSLARILVEVGPRDLAGVTQSMEVLRNAFAGKREHVNT